MQGGGRWLGPTACEHSRLSHPTRSPALSSLQGEATRGQTCGAAPWALTGLPAWPSGQDMGGGGEQKFSW